MEMAAMSEPSDELDQAIKAKDIDRFHKAYAKLTAACNACHEATGFSFIKIASRACRRWKPRRSPTSRSRASSRPLIQGSALSTSKFAVMPAKAGIQTQGPDATLDSRVRAYDKARRIASL